MKNDIAIATHATLDRLIIAESLIKDIAEIDEEFTSTKEEMFSKLSRIKELIHKHNFKRACLREGSGANIS